MAKMQTERSKIHILTIDDSPMVRTIVKQILIGMGFAEIYQAPDGMAGLRVVERHPIDLILCDLSMEPINGFEFVRFLRNFERKNLKELPVIILTMHGEQGHVERASDLDIDAYVLKPIVPKVLEERVLQVLKNRELVN